MQLRSFLFVTLQRQNNYDRYSYLIRIMLCTENCENHIISHTDIIKVVIIIIY